MNWKQGSPYHLESACRRYTVSKAGVNGAAVYTAWRAGDPPVMLATERGEGAVDRCKAACETDAGDRIGRRPE